MPLESLRDDRARLCAGFAARSIEGINDVHIVVTINRYGIPAESAKFVGEAVHVELIHRALALAEAIHIEDRVTAIAFLPPGVGRGFPDGAISTFAITQQRVRCEAASIKSR